MKLPLGILLTLALLLISQNLQQVSTQIPDEWKRSNETVNEDGNGEQSLGTAAESTGGNEDTQAIPLNSGSENEGQTYGSIYYSENGQQDQNSTTTKQIPPYEDVLPANNTEEAGADGPVATTPPPMIAFNSSSEHSDTSAEHNETQTPEATSNTSISEPVQTNQTVLNNTYPDPKPENSTGESSHEGSGSTPSEEAPTRKPTSTTEVHEDQENIQNRTTVKPPEPPAYPTTQAMIPPAIPEEVTTAAPDNENIETNLNGSFDTRGDSGKEFTSEVQEKKKGQGWAVLLVIMVIVGIIALTAFIILNRRNRRDFSHRKLVEVMSPDPVLRLDNSEPLDFGYYNPGLQMDNIQMTNFPQGRLN